MPLLGEIDIIDNDHPLELLQTDIQNYGYCIGFAVSPDQTLLATFTSVGTAQLYSLTSSDFSLIATLQDPAETQISEYFTGHFFSHFLIVGGRRKSLYAYSQTDLDNAILPCDMVVYDCDNGQVVQRVKGHNEEVLRIIPVGKSELLTSSEDGYIIRWHMNLR